MSRTLLGVLLWLAWAAIPLPLILAGETADLKAWPQGPIRYISRADEIKVYKTLRRDEDRVLFIERFWARRDPTPETLTNEYRQLFWERVREASDRFLDTAKPGWLSDRGKVHILYGPPSEIQEASNVGTGAILRWIYDGRPAGRRDLDPIVVVPFVRKPSGEYKLSNDPELASVFFDERLFRDRQNDPATRFANSLRSGRSELSVMLDLGKMQEVPPQAQVLMERVDTVESYETQPLTVRLDRFRHPRDGQCLVVITVDCTGMADSARPSILARLTPSEPGLPTRMLDEASFRLETGERFRLAQGRLVLAPGTYEVTVFAVDPATAATGLFRARLDAAVEAPRPRFSDIVLAAEVESLPYAALASYDEPFHVGAFRVVPKIHATYLRGDVVNVFYEIYDAEPPYRVTYQVEGRDVDGSWIALGRPAEAERDARAEAWALSTTESWPLGEYRVRVDVVDRADRRITVDVPFALESREGL